jgi:ketosteroid isomerase-like protein
MLEQRWTAAELSGNANTLGSMLAEDYLGIAPDGRLDSKADTLRSVRDGLMRFASIKTTTHKIRVYGSTAVVVSTAEVSGTYNGHPISGRYRYTRVYHLDGAGWKIVSFEASRIREHGERRGPNAPDSMPATAVSTGGASS